MLYSSTRFELDASKHCCLEYLKSHTKTYLSQIICVLKLLREFGCTFNSTSVQVVLPNVSIYIWLIFCKFTEHAHPLHRVMSQTRAELTLTSTMHKTKSLYWNAGFPKRRRLFCSKLNYKYKNNRLSLYLTTVHAIYPSRLRKVTWSICLVIVACFVSDTSPQASSVIVERKCARAECIADVNVNCNLWVTRTTDLIVVGILA